MRTPVFLASLVALAVAPALTTASPALTYRLGSQAAVQQGCFGPCACAVLIQSALGGTFTLDPDGFDGAFHSYRVLDVRWQYKTSDGLEHQVTGSGTYAVGGDQQQMVVDLSVDGGVAQRYDSGLTGGGSSFPQIRLPISENGFQCFDTVYGVDASPGPVGVGDPASTAFALRVGPNPFRGVAEILFALPREGAAEVRIHDLTGREVRTLASSSFSAGAHSLTWDGRDARGSRVRAGVYFVRLRAEGRVSRATVVKIE
jgi:hypothetical protein